MRSAQPGKRTSDVEVLSISARGLWLLVDGQEYLLGVAQFPWFKKAPVSSVLKVHRPGTGHLYWPDLDVDIAVESIEHPGRFPLMSRVRPTAPKRPARTGPRAQSGRSSGAGR